jgi:serine/threonine-protein kinase
MDRQHLQSALGERYTIERELGRGGMATVFLARDRVHERAVAIKVLREEVTAAIGAERFQREIEIAGRLVHPSIVSLSDCGHAGDALYYVMPYVHGETLRARLDRERQLPVADAVAITCELADALDHAHANDVIHRDIKPDNILLRGDHPYLADFGVARAVVIAAADSITVTGVSVGTPGYMSPEQASGDKRVDGRADQYALACVLYEMLAGQPPFTGPNPQAVVAKHALAPVPSLHTIRPEVPEGVERAMMRALEKSADERYPTAADFARALHGEYVTAEMRAARRRWVPGFAGSKGRIAVTVVVLAILVAIAAALR